MTLDYTTFNGSALTRNDGNDYNDECTYILSDCTVTFEPGQTTQIVRVEIGDTQASSAYLRSFTFNIGASTAAPLNATIARATQMVSIVNNLQPPVASPGLFVRNATVDAAAGTVSIPVLLGGPQGEVSDSPITVTYATSDISAVAGTDYTATTGTLTFAPGQTVQNVMVPIIDAPGARPTRYFALTLNAAKGATILNGTGVVTIGASRAKAVSLPSASVGPDVIVGEGDGYVDLPITLSAPGTLPVTLDYTTVAGTACPPNCQGAEYRTASGAATFAPGETTKVVRVELEDASKIPTMKFFTFSINTPMDATIARASQMVSIVPNGTLVATPSLSVQPLIVDAAAGTVSVPVLLGGPQGEVSSKPVTVTYATSDISAIAGTDYTATTGTLAFAPGQTVRNVMVPIIDASGARPTRHFAVTLSNAKGATILNGPGIVTIGASGSKKVNLPGASVGPDVTVGEADGYVDLPITLSAPGTLPVTLDYTTVAGTACPPNCPGAEYVTASGAATFAPGETTSVVRVDLVDNSVAYTNEHFTFTISTATNATIKRSTQTVNIVSSPVHPAITSAHSSTFTTGKAGSFTVVTSGYPAATLTESGTLPSGVTFTNNFDGTATLGGAPATGSGGSYVLTISAHNGVAPAASQKFTLNVRQPESITSPTSTVFTKGTVNSFQVSTSGFPAAKSITETGILPAGVTFTFSGGSTATLSSTSALSRVGSFAIAFTATNGVGKAASQSFTLHVA